MSSDKPSRNEDEYFAREEAERLRHLREKDSAERTARERRSHHLKCPKCGGDLHAETFHGVQIDRCPDCHGMWFDAGEIDLILKEEDAGVLRKIMGDVRASLQKLRPRP
jgi:Zn-finger nucleic acid-binding protein